MNAMELFNFISSRYSCLECLDIHTKYAINYLKLFTWQKCRQSGYGIFMWHSKCTA